MSDGHQRIRHVSGLSATVGLFGPGRGTLLEERLHALQRVGMHHVARHRLAGKLVGLLQAPATKIAGVLQAPAGAVARVIAAHAEKAA